LTLLEDMDPIEVLYCLKTEQISYDDLMQLEYIELLSIEEELMNVVAISKSENNPEFVIWNNTIQ
jgi:hypothetical protein